MRPKPIIPQFHQMVLTVALHKKSPAGFWTSPIRIRRSPMSNRHVQSAKAIADDIAHLCCVPDDWRLQISYLAAFRFPTFCAKPRNALEWEDGGPVAGPPLIEDLIRNFAGSACHCSAWSERCRRGWCTDPYEVRQVAGRDILRCDVAVA